MDRIVHDHETVYEMFACLQSRNALCRIYGNHNMELRKILPEAIILDNCEGGRDVCMIHGHQADFLILCAEALQELWCATCGNRWSAPA